MTASAVGGAASECETSSGRPGWTMREITAVALASGCVRRGGRDRDDERDQHRHDEEGDASHDASG